MAKPPPADDSEQLQLYQQAVRAIGGIRPHAQLLGMSERHGGRLFSGAVPLNPGILADTARALLAHADLCRDLERKLSPTFSSNLTEHQRTTTPRGHRRRDPKI